jgi:hypothetical protein
MSQVHDMVVLIAAVHISETCWLTVVLIKIQTVESSQTQLLISETNGFALTVTCFGLMSNRPHAAAKL